MSAHTSPVKARRRGDLWFAVGAVVAGYSLQPPPGDPDALVCRRDGVPPPDDGPGDGGLLSLALAPHRRQYP